MKWVTRERPKIDRIACPWLIRRFIDPQAQILYVHPARVHEVAAAESAVPFDVPHVELGHAGDRCSFDAFLAKYRLTDPALACLAEIIRAADTNRPDLSPQAPGLLAISSGLRENIADDQALLAAGMVMYDALYAWCRSSEPERSDPNLNWKTPA